MSKKQQNKLPGGKKTNNPNKIQKEIERKPRTDFQLRVGVVKSVPSGDSVTIIECDDLTVGPKEILFTFLALKAPQLGRRTPEGKIKDEPFAWQSREFLRKLVIGEPVIYRIEHHDVSSDRHYGELWDRKQNDIRSHIVANGWADVIKRERKGTDGNVLEPFPAQLALEKLLHDAKTGKLGVWSSNTKDAVRTVKYIEPFRDVRTDALNYEDLYEFFKARKDKKTHNAVVESIKTGSQVTILLPETMEQISISLSGIRCPGLKGETHEPFFREAKFFTEYHLLHRSVTVTFDSIDKVNVFGTVLHNGDNIAFDLLKNGLANLVDWSVPKGNTALLERLKEEEKDAQSKKQRLWRTHQPVSSPDSSKKDKASKESSVVHGKVVEIVNAGTITVRVTTSNTNKTVDRIISLSSIRPPRLLMKFDEVEKDKVEEIKRETAFALEAKEFLRNLLIGQKVKCVFDYGRPDSKVPPVVKLFWSVYYPDGNKEKSVAVELVRQGLAKVLSHSEDESRSVDYQELVVVEKEAISQHKGWHSNVYKKTSSRLNDLTPVPQTHDDDAEGASSKKTLAAKCRQFFPFLQKQAKLEAIVEYVFAASRFKVVIPSNSCVIMFSLQGMLVEKPERIEIPPNHVKPDISSFDKQYPPSKPGNLALHFTRDHVFQRKVLVTVTNVDKFGNFMGVMFVNNKDFGLTLIENGHARLHTRASYNLPGYTAYKTAEESARENRVGLWATYDFAAEADRKAKDIAARNSARSEKPPFPVVITDFRTGSTFSYQIINEEAAQLDELASSLKSEKFQAQPSYLPQKGEIVAAQFTSDDNWYRAQIISDNKGKGKDDLASQFEVRYIDYGNREVITRDRIRQLPKEYLQMLPPQAQDGKLFGVKTPELDEDFGQESAVHFRDLVWNKTLTAQEVHKVTVPVKDIKDPQVVYYLILKDDKTNINAELVSSGYARVDKGEDERDFQVKQLIDAQDEAYNGRKGIWQFGYYPDSDEEREAERSLLR